MVQEIDDYLIEGGRGEGGNCWIFSTRVEINLLLLVTQHFLPLPGVCNLYSAVDLDSKFFCLLGSLKSAMKPSVCYLNCEGRVSYTKHVYNISVGLTPGFFFYLN